MEDSGHLGPISEDGIRITKTSIEVFFPRFFPRLVYYIVQFGLDPQVGEDIAVEVFLKLWKVRSGLFFPSEDKLRNYLFHITRNDTINYLKKNRSERLRHLAYVALDDPAEVSDAERKALAGTAAIEAVYKSIEALPEQQRKVMRMKIQGKSTDEIADELNIAAKTVRNHYRIGLESLKGRLMGNHLALQALICLGLIEAEKFIGNIP